MPQFTAPSTVEKPTHQVVRIPDLRLHRAAAPAMAAVHRDLGELEVALLLTGRLGRVIDRWAWDPWPGDPATATAAIAAALGTRRESVGTRRESVGPDRDVDRTNPACSAAVVSDPGTGGVIGVIAVTYPNAVWQPLMQALIGRMVHETRQRLLSDVMAAPQWSALTRAERNVVRHVAKGLTNRETAEKLFVSAHTVDYHLRRVFQKLGLRSRVELAHLVGIEADAKAVC
jgi:DNA-binding CsgD family transcriptional regulator